MRSRNAAKLSLSLLMRTGAGRNPLHARSASTPCRWFSVTPHPAATRTAPTSTWHSTHSRWPLPTITSTLTPSPDANSLATAQAVRDRLDELKKAFPEDVDYVVSLDMTPFIQESINEVVRTLIEEIGR